MGASSIPPPDIRWQAGKKLPAGPAFLPRLLRGEVFRQNAAAFLLENARHHGDLVYFRALGRPVVQFNHPELVQEMLVRDAGFHHRNLVMQRAKAVLGEGLLTSEEPLHMRQRRLAQPAFHRQRIAGFGEMIAAATQRLSDGWSSGATLDVHAEMQLLALRIVGKTLFDTDVEQDVAKIAAAVNSFQGLLPVAFLPFSSLIQRSPLPAMRRIRRGREQLDALIYRMIRERRAEPSAGLHARSDLLSMLMAAEDDEAELSQPAGAPLSRPLSGSAVQPARMSDAQLRDECLTILLAGHETTANALSFALWLLAQHSEIQSTLAAECARVLGGRMATAADYAQLGLAEQVFAEALRLYPPVWVTARTAAVTYEYRGMRIEQGTVLIAPQFVVHRDPRFFPDPLVFDPARFAPAAKAMRPRLAFFPFGAGNRQCIGEGLAWMEGTLALATMLRDWRVSPAAATSGTLQFTPSVSLRPRGPVRLRVERRGGPDVLQQPRG